MSDNDIEVVLFAIAGLLAFWQFVMVIAGLVLLQVAKACGGGKVTIGIVPGMLAVLFFLVAVFV